MQFNLTKLPASPLQVIREGVRLYAASFSKVWWWQLLFSVPLIIAAALLSDSSAHSLRGYANLLVIIGAVISLLITLYGNCFIYARLNGIAIQVDPGARAAFALAGRKLPLVLAGVILFYLMIVALLFLGSVSTSIAIVILAGILLIGFMIFTLFPAMLYMLIILFNGVGVFKAISQSYALVWGNWWRTFMVIVLGIMLPAAILSALMNLFHNVISEIAALLFSTVAVPYMMAVTLVLFYDLSARRSAKMSLLQPS